MITTLYFAYGANTNFESMAWRCQGAEFITDATLYDHELVFRGVADVIENPGKKVTGALWRITEQHEVALDRFEGYPHLYEKRLVTVTLPSSEKLQAMLYYMNPGHPVSPPSPQYYETLHIGYQDCRIPLQQLYASVAKSREVRALDGAENVVRMRNRA